MMDQVLTSLVVEMIFNNQIRSIPPMPNSPDHPERPPPNIPIPGQPSTSSKEKHMHTFKCKECGKIFNSKDELKEHIHTEHPKNIKPKEN